MIKEGHLFYTRKVSEGIERGALTYTLKRPIAVLALGAPTETITDSEVLDVTLFNLGLFYLDDIREICGDESAEKLLAHIKQKYSHHLKGDTK